MTQNTKPFFPNKNVRNNEKIFKMSPKLQKIQSSSQKRCKIKWNSFKILFRGTIGEKINKMIHEIVWYQEKILQNVILQLKNEIHLPSLALFRTKKKVKWWKNCSENNFTSQKLQKNFKKNARKRSKIM